MTSEEKEQLDIMWLYRLDHRNTHGWQFRIAEGTPEYHSKLFSDSGRHSDVSLEEARKYRNEYLAKHPHLRAVKTPVWLQLPKHNKSGILGVNYSERILPSGTLTGSWQMTCPRPEGGTPKTKRFSTRELGETRALMKAVQARREATLELAHASVLPNIQSSLKQLIGEYDDIIAELQESLDKDCNSELLNIIQEARLDATSKRVEIQIRLGQHRFRRLVLQRWQSCCAATGANILINASHIKPWRHASNFDRINPYNGLALSPIYDRAFDLGYISFSDDGSILASSIFREQLLRLGMNLSVRISGLTEDHRPYLEYHRKHIFRDSVKSTEAT